MDFTTNQKKFMFEFLKAISKQDSSLISRIITPLSPEDKFKVIQENLQGVTPLLMAVCTDNADLVKFLIEDLNAPVNQVGLHASFTDFIPASPLCLAISLGHFNIANVLIQHGADVNYVDGQRRSCLRYFDFRKITQGDRFKILKLLIDHGADVNFQDSSGETCLMASCKVGITAVAQYFLEKGASVGKIDNDGCTALHHAAGRSGSLTIVKMLLRFKANIQVLDKSGQTPLIAAAAGCHLHVVDFLCDSTPVSEEEEINILKLTGASFIDRMDDIETGLRLWKKAARVRKRSPNNVTLDRQETAHSYFGNMKEFISNDDIKSLESDVYSLYMQALMIRERILGAHNPATTISIRRRANVLVRLDGKREAGIQLLLHALRLQQMNFPPLDSSQTLQTLALFCNLFAYKTVVNAEGHHVTSLNMNDFEEVFPVFQCAVHEISRWHSSNPNLDKSGCEDDYDFALSCSLQLLLMVVDAGDRMTATQKGLLKSSVRKLVDLNPTFKGNLSLVHFAASKPPYQDTFDIVLNFPSVKVTGVLLENGANVNALDGNRNTPLHRVCSMLKKRKSKNASMVRECIQILLDHGAHVDCRNNEGKTCEELAEIPVNFCPVAYTPLQCYAARAIVTFNVQYQHILPNKLHKYVELHQAPIT